MKYIYTVEDLTDEDLAANSHVMGNYRFCTAGHCPRTLKFSNSNAFKQHLVQHLNKSTINEMLRDDYVDGIRYYTCVQCHYRSRDRPNARRHVVDHLNIKKHQCPHCSYSTKRKDNLYAHVQRRHVSRTLGHGM